MNTIEERKANHKDEEITAKQVAEAISRHPYSKLKQFVVNCNGSGLRMIQGREYPLVLTWGGVGTQHSYQENPVKILPYLAKNIFDSGKGGDVTFIATFHTHGMVSEKDMQTFPFVKMGIKKYGLERFYMLASLTDFVALAQSKSHNNILSQIHMGRDINIKEIGIGIGVVGLNGRMSHMGFLDLSDLGKDARASKVVMTLLDKYFKAEKEGKEFVPYDYEMISFLDQIANYTLKNKLPDWFDQKSDLSFSDTRLTAMGGPDKIIKAFQSRIDMLPDVKWFSEFGMMSISTKRKDKLDTLVTTPTPMVNIPGAWEVLRGITKPGIPYITLISEEKTHNLFFHVDSGKEVETAEGIYKGGKAILSESEVLLVDGGWENYLPQTLLQELY